MFMRRQSGRTGSHLLSGLCPGRPLANGGPTLRTRSPRANCASGCGYDASPRTRPQWLSPCATRGGTAISSPRALAGRRGRGQCARPNCAQACTIAPSAKRPPSGECGAWLLVPRGASSDAMGHHSTKPSSVQLVAHPPDLGGEGTPSGTVKERRPRRGKEAGELIGQRDLGTTY